LAGLKAEALVDSACSGLRVGAGVDSAIYAKGGKELWARRQAVGPIAEGEVAATEACGALACRVVLHAVVPRWHGGGHGEEDALRRCIRRTLDAARAAKCETVAFPLLGAGHRGYPPEVALRAAVEELAAAEEAGGIACTLALYPSEAVQIARRMFGEVQDLLDAGFGTAAAIEESMDAAQAVLGDVPERSIPWRREARRSKKACSALLKKACFPGAALPPELEKKLEDVAPGVGKALMALMNAKHFDNRRLMIKTGISKQLLSKIQNGKHAKAPEKRWLLACSVAMGLTLGETRAFLATAGYALSQADRRDVVVAYFLERGGAKIEMVDVALASLDLPTLYPGG
jgi:O-acetyl-ADP-ribose deacetylase (regulator of RNase III)